VLAYASLHPRLLVTFAVWRVVLGDGDLILILSYGFRSDRNPYSAGLLAPARLRFEAGVCRESVWYDFGGWAP